jgi:hypothetical protein
VQLRTGLPGPRQKAVADGEELRHRVDAVGRTKSPDGSDCDEGKVVTENSLTTREPLMN